jgi:Glycine zipper
VTRRLFALVAAAALTTGCAGFPGFSDTQHGPATGALAGVAGGGAIGSIAGDTGWGAVTGAGVGAGGGYVYDKGQKTQH